MTFNDRHRYKPEPHLRKKITQVRYCPTDSGLRKAYIRSPAGTHLNHSRLGQPSMVRYLAYIVIAIIIATLGVALYGWYRHLRDDEDDIV